MSSPSPWQDRGTLKVIAQDRQQPVKTLGWPAIGGLLALALYLIGTTAFADITSDTNERIDLPTFVCAARALSSGLDPYRASSIVACEDDLLLKKGLRLRPNFVWDAPLLPGAIALITPFARVPAPFGDMLYDASVALASFGLVECYRRLAAVSRAKSFALVFFAVFIHEVARGQLAFYSILALSVAALSARVSALCTAIALGVALFEPHLAVGAILCALLALPALRRPLAIVLAIVAAASLMVGGLPLNVEYFGVELHGRASAELFHIEQYSLAMPLAALGASDDFSLRIATLQGVLTIAFGVFVGLRLVRRFDDNAYAIATPCAFSVVGGPFMHMTQMVAAIPLALLVARDAPRYALLTSLAVLPIALDPEDLFRVAPIYFVPITILVTILVVGIERFRSALMLAAISVGTAFFLWSNARPTLTSAHAGPAPPGRPPNVYDPSTLAAASNQYFLREYWNVLQNLHHLWLNGIVWLGLLMLLAVTCAACYRKPRPVHGPLEAPL